MKFNQVGLMITEKCNFRCGHCMFSCTDKGKDMTNEVLTAAKNFIEDNDVWDINIYGGEPFLDIELFDRVYKAVYDSDKGFFISSNGSFMEDKEKRAYVYNLMRVMSYSYREGTCIRISNTDFHKKCRTAQQQRWFEILEDYVKHPDEFWADEEDFDTYNPFYSKHGMSRIYIDPPTGRGMNPSGRALRNADLTMNECNCLMTCNLEKEKDEDQHFDIRPNGDIQICCTCDGCVVGNILEPGMNNELLTERVKKMHDFLGKKYDVDRYTRMVDLCEECHNYKIGPSGKIRLRKRS